MAVALCLGGALTACGAGGEDEGYAAVGAGSSPKGAVPPSGSVTLIPLDPGDTSSTRSPSPRPPGSTPPEGTAQGSHGDAPGAPPRTASAPPPSRTAGTPKPPAGAGTGAGAGSDSGAGAGAGTTTPATTPPPLPSTTPPPSSPTPAPPPAPATLTLSAPTLADTDRRWCESVTVTFRNTGGTAARSGTVEFATHIIGGLGIDWGTIRTSQPLPAPIAAGTARTRTYTVCVDSWRVPLGMHVDTRNVTASWQ